MGRRKIMDKTNYLLDKVLRLEGEMQLQAQLNLDTEQKFKTKVDKVDGKGLSTNDYDTTEKNNVANNTLARHTHDNKTVLDSTTASFTTEEKAKLGTIESEAKKNVQSDWAQTDSTSDDYIKNKPSVLSKLYSTTGQNTDGAMTQKATTDLLQSKVGTDCMKVLWENPSPTANFYPQTITLSSSDWDFLIIVCSSFMGGEPEQFGTITYNGSTSVNLCSISTDSAYANEFFSRRIIANSKTSLQVGDCLYSNKGSAGQVLYYRLIPLKVIGVKVV